MTQCKQSVETISLRTRNSPSTWHFGTMIYEGDVHRKERFIQFNLNLHTVRRLRMKDTQRYFLLHCFYLKENKRVT